MWAGLGAAVWGIEGFMQVLNLAPIQFGKIGMKSAGRWRSRIELALPDEDLGLHSLDFGL